MHSSISASEPGPGTTAAGQQTQMWLLLALCALVLGAAEVVARVAVPRLSSIEARVQTEKAAAVAPVAAGRKGLLLLGNSLLRNAIEPEALQAQLGAPWQVRRFVVEDTGYVDWYFGLRRLLAASSRPEVVALMLSPRQLASEGIRGGYSAYHLFGAADTIRAGRRIGAHPTELFGLAYSHFSAYYGLREIIRNFGMQKVVPGADTLAAALVSQTWSARAALDARIEPQAHAHLGELERLCKTYQVRCLFILPPSMVNQDFDAKVLRAAGGTALSTAELLLPGPWNASDFEADGYHMTRTGAARYTAAIAPRLRAVLDTR